MHGRFLDYGDMALEQIIPDERTTGCLQSTYGRDGWKKRGWALWVFSPFPRYLRLLIQAVCILGSERRNANNCIDFDTRSPLHLYTHKPTNGLIPEDNSFHASSLSLPHLSGSGGGQRKQEQEEAPLYSLSPKEIMKQFPSEKYTYMPLAIVKKEASDSVP